VKASFYWAGVCCVFEALPILRARCPGNSNGNGQAADFSRGSAAHFLVNGSRGSSEVKIESSGNDAHGGQHARSKGRGYKVSRGETFSSALIIDWCVCSEFSIRGGVHGRAVQITLIFHLNANHNAPFQVSDLS
jgi:hypothetical protein